MKINNVTFAGNLTRDPESRDVNGKTVAKFTLAYSERYKGSDGEMREDVTFIDCECWDRKAEIAVQYLTKGGEAGVTGKLRQESWTDKDGNKRSRIIIRVSDLILGAKREGGGDRAPAGDDGERAPRPNRPAPAPAKGDDEPPF